MLELKDGERNIGLIDDDNTKDKHSFILTSWSQRIPKEQMRFKFSVFLNNSLSCHLLIYFGINKVENMALHKFYS
jgi:hypothetical protein